MTKGAKRLKAVFARPKQKDVAKRLGIDPAHLSLLASGKRIPSMALAGKIQKELGIPVEAWTA